MSQKLIVKKHNYIISKSNWILPHMYFYGIKVRKFELKPAIPDIATHNDLLNSIYN